MQNTELAIKTGETGYAGTPKKAAGDYEIRYRIERAKGMYQFSSGKLEWKEPQEENTHLDVLISDPADGRPIPGLHVVATLLDGKGGRVASVALPFVWDPKEHHYGANVKVPESADYLLQVHIFPATFPRTDKEKGGRFVADVHVQFERVHIDV